MNAHTLQDLKMLQALSLEIKIRMTQTRIRDWINEYGEDGVYVSFSGGKDSTVLLHIVRGLYPNIPAVFIDTGLEYPEIRELVKTFENVIWLKPKMNFRQVIEKYGYPFISKEVSFDVASAREYFENPEKYKGKKPLAVQKPGEEYKPYALLKLNGELNTFNNMFNNERWQFLIKAPFKVSSKCCNVMKKAPVREYEKQTGRKPILATLAEESRMRTKAWLEHGCNSFNEDHAVSTPIAFWTEQDVLQYIKINKLPLASVYGDIIFEQGDEFIGQMDISEFGLADEIRPLKLTGMNRTGCMFCGFGCHLECPSRFERMKKTHPKIYDYIMRPTDKGGLNYKEIIDWINENGDGIHIDY